jgi:hypothetical protein
MPDTQHHIRVINIRLIGDPHRDHPDRSGCDTIYARPDWTIDRRHYDERDLRQSIPLIIIHVKSCRLIEHNTQNELRIQRMSPNQ